MTAKTRPTTRPTSTYASAGSQAVSAASHRWKLESPESYRLSPITNRCPFGTGPAVHSHRSGPPGPFGPRHGDVAASLT